MNKHNHCHHNLDYCRECDMAYCTKCGKEWGKKYYYYPYQYTYTFRDDGTYQITDANSVSAHTHVCTE